MVKRVLSILLAIIMTAGLLTVIPFTASAEEADISGTGAAAHTQAEAVKWAKAQEGKPLDIDGLPVVQPYQCVDLIDYYFQYLGVSIVWVDNAKDFATTNKLPGGWKRYSSPKPGDIAVWTGGGTGHVAIVTELKNGKMVCAEQNVDGKYYVIINTRAINAETYIRPDFKPAVTEAILDVNFYVDGKKADNIDGIGTIQVYVDGQLQEINGASSYTDFCQNVKVDKPYEVKVEITNPNYHFGGTDTYDETYTDLTGTTDSERTKIRLVIVRDIGGLISIPDGDYQIVSAIDSSYGLNIDGNQIPAAKGSNIDLQPVGSTPRPQDCFTLTNLGNGYYSITQKGTDMAVDVQGGYKNRYTNVQIYESNGTKAQQWKIAYDEAAGGYTLQSKGSGMHLTVQGGSMTAGSNIYQNIKNDSLPKAQGWKLIPLDPPEDRYLLGDADNNGAVEASDVTFIQRYVLSMDVPVEKTIIERSGDVDGSGSVSVMDATFIQAYLAMMETDYPIDAYQTL